MAEIFQPVRGLEENISKLTKHDGYIYFAYDSGNIYLDKNNERYLMGSSSSTGFSWCNGTEETIIKAIDDEEDTTYFINFEALESSVIPKPDSLILNSDGRFFRVLELNMSEHKIVANLIAVSGSGEGGGGSTPSIVDLDLTWSGIDLLGGTFIYEKNVEINFYPKSLVDEVCSLKITMTDSTGQVVYDPPTFRVRNNTKCTINASEFPIGQNLTITALVTSDHSTYNKGRGLSKTFTPIRVLQMYLEKPTDINMIPIQLGAATLSYDPYFTGLWTQRNPVKIYYNIDDGDGILYKALQEANDKNRQYIDIPHQSHGTHTIGLWLSVVINSQEFTSEKIYYEVPFVDSGNEDPIIWIQEELDTIVQYEPAVIKYMVYSSVAATTGSIIPVQFLQNGVLFDEAEISYNSLRWQTLDLTSKYTLGENHFSIVSGGTRKDINFFITGEGARNLDIIHSDQLEVNFDSMGRSNKQIKANRINFVSSVTPAFAQAPYSAQLNNFNWYNNGWLDDNDGNGSYLSVSNGASVRIPMSNIGINTDSRAWTFEIRFRIRNAKKFATLVTEIPIYEWISSEGVASKTGEELPYDEIIARGGTPKRDSDGNLVMNEANTTRKEVRTDKYIAFKFLNDDNYGFAIGTQEAYFNARGKVVNVKYREGEIINITFVENKAKNQLSIYLNGILSGVGNLSGTNAFSMTEKAFEINSEYCDFDLYKFRVYPIALTMPEVIHNYISDMKNIDLYDENQLTDINDATKLSYQKLLEYNETHRSDPTMPYVVIDMTGNTSSGNTELPFAKTAAGIDGARIEFVNPTGDYLLSTGEITPYDYYTHCPSYSGDNVNINVQGTSSQIYPRRNFKTKFKKAKNWNYTNGPLAGKKIAAAYYFNQDGTFAESIQAQVDEIQAGIDDGSIDKSTGKAQIKTLTTGLKQLTKNWHEDSEPFGSNKFTWKIDYMESSGSYNTGFANLMGNRIYYQTSTGQVHHPLDDLNIDGSGYRTCVYGFPMLAFHKTAENTYTYIGRYNCNLDKSANERYGFELEVEHPYATATKTVDNGDGTTSEVTYHPLIADVAECWELRDNQGLWCSFRYPQEATAPKFEMPISQNDPGIEVVKHFEARYHKYADQFEYGQNIILGKENTENYSADIGGTDKETVNAYLLDKLQNLRVLFDWLDSTDPLHVTNKPLSEVIGQQSITLRVNGTVEEEQRIAEGIEYTTENNIRYGTFTKDSKEYRRQKFFAEFDKHLDLHYCAVYFVMTELLLCYDSRGKNMMLASYGPHELGGEHIWYPIFYDIDTQLGLNNVGAQLWGYDENCTENKTFSTAESVLWMNFNDLFKEEILSVYRTLRGGGEDGILSYKNIEGAYNCSPSVFRDSTAMRGRRPLIAMGLDEYYKYVLPLTEEWRNQEGNMTTANYLYACQGDRKLSRELLINNRLLYMDSKWLAGSFTISTGGMAGIMFRSTGNKRNTTSDRYLDTIDSEGLTPGVSTITKVITDSESGDSQEYTFTYMPYKQGIAKYYDADPQYKVTPYLNFYITTFVDENTFQNSTAYNEETYPDGMPTVVLPSVLEGYQYGNVDQQLNYFAGSSYISSLGDLSTKYVNQVYIPNTPRLLDITLGSDAPDYFYNDKLDPFDLCTGVNDETGLPDRNADKSLLTKIILSNIRSLAKPDRDILDVRSPQKLTEFRALGTALSSVLFAEGAPLKIVHLPNTIERIIFIQNKDLTKILSTTPVVATMVNDELIYNDPSSYEGLYIAGVTDYVDSLENRGTGSPVNEIDIEGDAMGYDSYKILNNVVLKKNGSGRGNRLSIKMTDVNWTPYTQVEYGESKQQNVNYYILTDHSTYELYEGLDEDWQNDTLNGKIFTFDENAPKAIISDLSLLDTFLADYADTSTSINQFTNNVQTEISNKTYPALSGQLFVANANANVGISETALSNTYAAAWPNLVIRAEKIETSFLTKYVEIDPNSGKEIVLDNKTFSDSNTIGLPPASRLKVPTRSNYDFKGFSPNKPDEIGDNPVYYVVRNQENTSWELTEAGAAATIDSEKKVQVLYAIFEPHPFEMNYFYKDNLNTPFETIYCPYTLERGTIVQPSNVPYMDESELSIDQKYAFLGYSNAADSDEVVDFSILAPTRNMNFYAVFEEKSVYEHVTDSQYFDFAPVVNGYTDIVEGYYDENNQYKVVDSNYNVIGPTCSIKLKDGVVLSGKITLPASGTITYNGNKITVPVTHIADQGFYDNNTITHVFFERNNKYRVIGQKAFAMAGAYYEKKSKLKYIDYADSGIRAINTNAFQYCSVLESYELPRHLIDLQAYAFSVCFKEANDVVIRLGSEILRIGTLALNNVNLGNNAWLEIGTANNPSNIDLLLTNYGGAGSADRRLIRVNQTNNPGYAVVKFYSAKYDDETDIVGTISGIENTTVGQAFVLSGDTQFEVI